MPDGLVRTPEDPGIETAVAHRSHIGRVVSANCAAPVEEAIHDPVDLTVAEALSLPQVFEPFDQLFGLSIGLEPQGMPDCRAAVRMSRLRLRALALHHVAGPL